MTLPFNLTFPDLADCPCHPAAARASVIPKARKVRQAFRAMAHGMTMAPYQALVVRTCPVCRTFSSPHCLRTVAEGRRWTLMSYRRLNQRMARDKASFTAARQITVHLPYPRFPMEASPLRIAHHPSHHCSSRLDKHMHQIQIWGLLAKRLSKILVPTVS